MGSSSSKNVQKSEPKSLAILALLLLLLQGKLELEHSLIGLDKLFFKGKIFSKKTTSRDSKIVLLEIAAISELITKNLEVVLCKEYPTKTQSTVLGSIFFS